MLPILKVQYPPSAKASAIFMRFFFIHVFGSKSSREVER